MIIESTDLPGGDLFWTIGFWYEKLWPPDSVLMEVVISAVELAGRFIFYCIIIVLLLYCNMIIWNGE